MSERKAQASGELAEVLLGVQRDLWVLMAELATAPENAAKLVDGRTRTTVAMVDGLTRRLDDFEGRFAAPQEFVVPGEDPVAAALDVARWQEGGSRTTRSVSEG